MTVIAYKDKVIAYDSRVTAGSLIVDDSFDKKVTRDGYTFICAGGIDDQILMVDAFFGSKRVGPDIFAAAIMVNRDCDLFLLIIDTETGRLTQNPIDKKKPRAIGSGRDYALAAMDLGQTAQQAVRCAIKRDNGCGGKIRFHQLYY